MIKVLFTSFRDELPPPVVAALMETLPPEMACAIGNFRRWQDRHRALLAKLLLRAGLLSCGYPGDILNRVEIDSYGRPRVGPELDFNISHSGNYILCALAQGQRVGIDIEEHRPIALVDFREVFSLREWALIEHSPDPQGAFYAQWTRKESAAKADGRGLSLPPEQIELEPGVARIGSVEWRTIAIDIARDYSCHLTTNGLVDYELVPLTAVCYHPPTPPLIS